MTQRQYRFSALAEGARALARPAGRDLLVAVFFVALAAWAMRPLPSDLAGRTLWGIDPPIYVWTIDWLARHLTEPTQLLHGNTYFPSRYAALYSDLALGSALLVAPLAPLVKEPVALFNLSVILTLAFGGWGLYTLTRGLTGSVPAGLVAGVLGAYGSHQLFHVYQLGLINVGALALFLLGLFRTLEAPVARNVVLTGAAFALTVLSCAYFAVSGALLALVFAAAHAKAFRSRRVVAAFAASVLLASVLLVPYLRGFAWLSAKEQVSRPLVASEDWAFKPRLDLFSTDAYVYKPFFREDAERLFPGLASLVLSAFAVARRVRGWPFLLAGAGLLGWISLGPTVQPFGVDLGWLYRALFSIPPLDVMMHPYTFAAVARILLCVLAGLGLASLAPLREGRWRRPAGAAAVLLALVETAGPGPEVRAVPPGIPPVYELLSGEPEAVSLEVPLEVRDAYIWAARHRRRVANGAGGVSPRDHGVLERALHKHWIRAARRGQLDVDSSWPTRLIFKMPIDYVIVPAGRTPDLVPLREALDRSTSFTKVATASDGDVLYRVRR
jgi:hypothetical protein